MALKNNSSTGKVLPIFPQARDVVAIAAATQEAMYHSDVQQISALINSAAKKGYTSAVFGDNDGWFSVMHSYNRARLTAHLKEHGFRVTWSWALFGHYVCISWHQPTT